MKCIGIFDGREIRAKEITRWKIRRRQKIQRRRVFKKEQCKLAKVDHCDAETNGRYRTLPLARAFAGRPDQRRTMMPVSSSHLVVPGYDAATGVAARYHKYIFILCKYGQTKLLF